MIALKKIYDYVHSTPHTCVVFLCYKSDKRRITKYANGSVLIERGLIEKN